MEVIMRRMCGIMVLCVVLATIPWSPSFGQLPPTRHMAPHCESLTSNCAPVYEMGAAGDFVSGVFGIWHLLAIAAANLLRPTHEGSSAINAAFAETWGRGSLEYRLGFVAGIIIYLLLIERMAKKPRKRPDSSSPKR